MTIFKKIIDRQIPAKIFYEDDLCLVFHDVAPQAPHHLLIIPKKEIVSMNEIHAQDDKELLGHLMVVASQVARQLGVDESGYRLVINTKGDGGQTVFHLHIHLLAGRTLKWPPG